MVEEDNPLIEIDLAQFKLHLNIKDKIRLSLHFNSESRRFYLSVIALVLQEMKKSGKITSIPLEKHYDTLALLNETVGGKAGSSDREKLLPRIYVKWKDALPDLEHGQLFKALGKKKEYDDAGGKTYLFTDEEKDAWANLFDYKGSKKQVRLRFSIDKLGVALDDVLITFADEASPSGEKGWDYFLKSLTKSTEKETEQTTTQQISTEPVSHAPAQVYPPPESPASGLQIAEEEKLSMIQRYLPAGLAEKIIVQRGNIEGERKQVTVMFCNVEGYTALSERLDPEEIYSIMNEVFEILINKVHDYGGTVNEISSDGIMALFGAPIAQENAPQRAIRSALAIHREMVRFSDSHRGGARSARNSPAHTPLKVRIGIHTGAVVVGTVGNDLRVEFKAVGDTVNLASSVRSFAEPGTTYVTDETFKLTEGLFRFEAVGDRKVKGKKSPVKTYRVIAASGMRTRFDVNAERGLTPFVGRERELELLLEGYQRARGGIGQAFSIVSEAGVGKSRLLYEFRKAVANEEVIFLEGKCLSYTRSVAYHAVIDLLKSNFDINDSDGDSEIRKKVRKGLKVLGEDETSTLPYLLELLAVEDTGMDTTGMNPEVKKDRILEALKRIVLKGSEMRPLVMAVEDVQWIDPSSEEAFKYLLDNISGANVILIFTYRPEFEHTWGGRSYHSQVNLNRLNNRESLAMVAYLLDTEDIDSNLEELTLEKTEGVPFFIEEFIKSLKELKMIEMIDGNVGVGLITQRGTDPVIEIPSTIQDVIMARVDSLPDDAKALLQRVSVMGREFEYSIVKKVTGLSERELLSHLSASKDKELIYERGLFPQSIYIFRHALTQEVVYGSILSKRKKEIHEKIGMAIEDIYAERLEEFYELLAHHYSVSENLENAYRYLKLSGDKATRNYSNWEAFRFYKETINVLNRMPETEPNKKKNIEVHLLISNPMHLLGYHEDSLQILQEGEKLSKEIGDERNLAIFLGKIGSYYSQWGETLLAVKYTENSFRIAEKTLDIELIAPIAVELCFSYIHSGESSKIVDVVPKILDILEKANRKNDFFGTRFNVYSGLSAYYGVALGRLGNFTEGIDLFERGLRFALQVDHPFSVAQIEFFYGILFYHMGDGKNCIHHIQKSIGYFEETQAVQVLGAAWSILGAGYNLLGELETARNHVEKGLKIDKDRGFYFLSVHYHFLSNIYFELGDLDNAQGSAEKGLELAQKHNQRFYESSLKMRLGRIIGKRETSRVTVAEEHILQGISISNELKTKPASSEGYLFLGELHADAGQKEKSLGNLKKAEENFREMGMDYWLAKTQEVLARL